MAPVQQQNRSLIYVVIVNWNGWADTLECLESLFRSDFPEFRVVVCDNGSTDGSLENIKSWAEGRLIAGKSSCEALGRLASPPIAKPIDYVEYSRHEAEAGGSERDPLLALVRVGANLGFAGGNNVGIRYALSRNDFSSVWLLNNDTVVTPHALSALARRMEEKPSAGICGSTLVYYHDPDTVQGLGGAVYNKWLGTNRHVGFFHKHGIASRQDAVEKKMHYVIGASMLVSRKFLEEIGLMCEDYFLYFEELDWAFRAKGRFTLAFAADSIVYHKEGSSAGTCDPRRRSMLVDYYAIRSRLLFTHKFAPAALPTVYMGLLCALLNRIRRRQWERVRMIAKLALSSHKNLLTIKLLG